MSINARQYLFVSLLCLVVSFSEGNPAQLTTAPNNQDRGEPLPELPDPFKTTELTGEASI